MRILRVIYVVAIAVVLVLLVIAGIHAFYPPPPYPDYPEYPVYPDPLPAYNSTEYEEWQQQWREAEEKYQQALEEYHEAAAVHDRNIFFIVLPLGAVFAVGGTFIRRRVDIFGAGLVLGGIGTMIFAIVSDDLDNTLRFIGIAVVLTVLIFVGYKVFLSARRS